MGTKVHGHMAELFALVSYQQGRFVRYQSWKGEYSEMDENDSISYGDLKEVAPKDVQQTDLYEPPYMTGSDYSGGSVEVSNHRVFLESFGSVAGVHDVYGDYSTYSVVVRVDCVTEDMIELFRELQGYPLIDEEEHSKVEMEAQDEAWSSWARDDFRAALIERFPELEDALYEQHASDNWDQLGRILLEEAASEANEQWRNETGNTAWLDVERVAAAVSEEKLKAMLGS